MKMRWTSSEKRLVIILGPTGVGKTDYSIALAHKYDSPIISCDSRQLYKEMSIGTAVPSMEQLSEVRHYFIQDRSVTSPLSAGMYELEALQLMERLFDEGHDTLVMCGGSMFYIDAVCKGIPEVPEADPDLRAGLNLRLKEEGLDPLVRELRERDPEACSKMDLSNGARVLRALEVCLSSGRTFSSFRMASPKKRPFAIEKVGISRPRGILYERINRRVDSMIESGLIEEVRSLKKYRNLTSLNTVGYRELFAHLDYPDTVSLADAVTSIKANTRTYAKKQLTWWKRDDTISWINL